MSQSVGPSPSARSSLDDRLAAQGAQDPVMVAINALLRVLPEAEALPPRASLAAVAEGLLPGQGAALTPAAAAYAEADDSQKALWVVTGLDAGDGIVSVVSSVRSAVALYLRRRGGQAAPAAWTGHQRADAVLKLLAIAHLLDRLHPGADDPVREAAALPAGRAVLCYFAAVELGLPFLSASLGPREEGAGLLSELIEHELDAQRGRATSLLGTEALARAEAHLPRLVPAVERLLRASASRLDPLAQAAEQRLPGANVARDGVADVLAIGADVLPVYRTLGLRWVAEAAVARAAQAQGRWPADPVAEAWISRNLPPKTPQLPPPLPPGLALGAEAAPPWSEAPSAPSAEPPPVPPGFGGPPPLPAAEGPPPLPAGPSLLKAPLHADPALSAPPLPGPAAPPPLPPGPPADAPPPPGPSLLKAPLSRDPAPPIPAPPIPAPTPLRLAPEPSRPPHGAPSPAPTPMAPPLPSPAPPPRLPKTAEDPPMAPPKPAAPPPEPPLPPDIARPASVKGRGSVASIVLATLFVLTLVCGGVAFFGFSGGIAWMAEKETQGVSPPPPAPQPQPQPAPAARPAPRPKPAPAAKPAPAQPAPRPAPAKAKGKGKKAKVRR